MTNSLARKILGAALAGMILAGATACQPEKGSRMVCIKHSPKDGVCQVWKETKK